MSIGDDIDRLTFRRRLVSELREVIREDVRAVVREELASALHEPAHIHSVAIENEALRRALDAKTRFTKPTG